MFCHRCWRLPQTDIQTQFLIQSPLANLTSLLTTCLWSETFLTGPIYGNLRPTIYAVINLRGVSTNKTIIYFIAMQTYKELKTIICFIAMQTYKELTTIYCWYSQYFCSGLPYVALWPTSKHIWLLLTIRNQLPLLNSKFPLMALK
jgi:hypothetical protein